VEGTQGADEDVGMGESSSFSRNGADRPVRRKAESRGNRAGTLKGREGLGTAPVEDGDGTRGMKDEGAGRTEGTSCA
jgi:hypothetical protein